MKYYLLLCLIIIADAMALQDRDITKAYEEQTLTIYAASSLTEVFTEIANTFDENYDVETVINFAGSSTLAAQIEQGAAAAIFASANEEQMQRLVDEGYIEAETVFAFAENQLVIIVPADNPGEIVSAGDLARDGILLVMAAKSVPIRAYADSLIMRLNEFYGDDYGTKVNGNIVSEESNVRQVVARVVLGEADAAIVYRTDVTPDLSEYLLVIDLPPGVESPLAKYVIAPVIDSGETEEAKLFLEYITSGPAVSILHSRGFCLPNSDEIAPEPGVEATAEATPESESNDTMRVELCE